jgi:hypothetical protein
VVIGPEDLKADKSVENFSADNMRGERTRAGFNDITFA